MSEEVLVVKNLSKKYRLNHECQANTNLKEAISNQIQRGIQRLLRKSKPIIKSTSEEFWALRNVSFSLERGDKLGVIGRNGSGKSTLLKILSRITDPSEGSVSIKGRTASLLEVGTGFHPELTGRENIFLNGAILGMSSTEIKKKFDEIVEFAEIERFLDTPVKRYSSGMYTRLGFSIAAHLEPDILIVDEVLAVGDFQFQEKCLKKMNEMSSKGLTILFVTHHMQSALRICNKGLFLNKGQVQAFGSMAQCASEYESKDRISSTIWCGDEGDEHIRVKKMEFLQQDPTRDFYYQGEELTIAIEYEVSKYAEQMAMGIVLYNTLNQGLSSSHTSDNLNLACEYNRPGRYQVHFKLNTDQFFPGEYLVKVDCIIPQLKQIIRDEVSLHLKILPSGIPAWLYKYNHGRLNYQWCLENYEEKK